MSVGIFWFANNEIIGFKKPLSILSIDNEGIIDSNLKHSIKWDEINNTLYDYKYFPSGRVVFDANCEKYVVYFNGTPYKLSIKASICDFFGLKLGYNVIFK